MSWWHPGNKFFEELNVGDKFISPARTMTDADIHAFAGLSGDYHPLHTDDEVARQGDFGARICHGLLSLSVLTGLFVPRLGLFEATGLAFLGIDNLRYYKPVYPGNTIHAELEVMSKRESRSKPDRGVVTFHLSGAKADGEKFLECDWLEMVARYSWKEQQAQVAP